MRTLSVSWFGANSNFINLGAKPISARPGYRLLMGVKKFSTFNGFTNINSTNNIFTYTSGVVRTITLPAGSYNIDAIQTAIRAGMKNLGETDANINNFIIQINYANVGTVIQSPFNFDFTVEKSINTVLGFNAQTYVAGTYFSQNAGNITNNDVVYITCSSVSEGITSNFLTPGSTTTPGTIVPTVSSNVIYLFNVSSNVGDLVQENENNPIYLPCTNNSISGLNFQLINSYGQTADNPNQKFTLFLEFKEELIE